MTHRRPASRSPSTPTTTRSRRTPTRSTPGCASTSRCTTTRTLDLWALTRHADIAEAVRTEGTYSNSLGVAIEKSAWGPDAHKVMSILGMDPPRQKRLRVPGLPRLHPAPRPRPAAADPAAHRPLPRRVPGDGQLRLDRRLRRQAPDGRHLRDDGRPRGGPRGGTPPGRHRGAPRGRRLRRAAGRRWRRRCGWSATTRTWSTSGGERPSDDLTSALIEAEVDGERLTDEDVIAFLFLMVVAGNETTTKLLGHALFHLTRHPDQLDEGLRRRRRPATWSCPWIEETLRFDTSSQLLARYLLARRRAARHGRAAGLEAAALPRLGQPRRAGLQPPRRLRHLPRQGRARRRSCPSAAAGTSASAPTWPGSRPGSR